MLLLLLLAGFALGGLLTVQVGVNAVLRPYLGQALPVAVVSFLVGLAGLLLAALLARSPLPNVAAAGRAPWWAWTGGLMGATYVLSAVGLAPRLGASVFFAVLVAGQLSLAVVVDHFGLIGFAEHRVTLVRLLGVASLLLGVWLVRK